MFVLLPVKVNFMCQSDWAKDAQTAGKNIISEYVFEGFLLKKLTFELVD